MVQKHDNGSTNSPLAQDSAKLSFRVYKRAIVPEIGSTKRTPGIVIIVLFCAILFAVPLVQFVWELAKEEKLQEFDILLQMPTLERITRYEDALSDSAILGKMARPWVQWTQLLLVNQGNEKVVIGLDKWLFFRSGLRYATGPGFRTFYVLGDAKAKHPDPRPAILDFHKQLSERGIELVIVPIPNKSQIYPEKLTRSYDASQGPPVNLYEKEFFEELDSSGVTVINLARVLWDAKAKGELIYMPMDTHWTPLGMSIFADALAKELKLRFPWLAEPEHTYKTRPLEITNRGDIYDMLGLPASSKMYAEQTITVEQVVDTETGELVEPDPDSPVALLGDSFSNVLSVGAMKWGDHAGLGEHLALHFGRPVDVIALNGGAPTGTRRTLARRGSGNIEGKKLVIWEFVTRELIDTASEWEKVELPKAGVKVTAGPIEVKAEVILVSRTPVPNEDPYPDCVTFTKYRVLSVEDGEYADEELIVVQWVMRDFKLLPAAEIKVGDVHHLVLVPYSKELDPNLRQAKESDDTNDYAHQPYWVKEMKQQ